MKMAPQMKETLQRDCKSVLILKDKQSMALLSFTLSKATEATSFLSMLMAIDLMIPIKLQDLNTIRKSWQ